MTLEEIEKELVKFSESDKQILLRLLIADLDSVTGEDVEHLWLEEAQRRYEELKEGVVTGVPAGQAIARVRERLGSIR